MPYKDQTGPAGAGLMTGRGSGPCNGGFRRGMCGLGWFGSGFGPNRRWTSNDEKLSLVEEEKALEEELSQVRAEKEALKKKK